MNPWYTFKALTGFEKDLCCRLVVRAGPLGWDGRSLKAAHIDFSMVESLVGDGILRRVTVFQLAQEFVGKKSNQEQRIDLEGEGGFLAGSRKDKLFIRSFDLATKIVQTGLTGENMSVRYQVANQGLFTLIDHLVAE